jgi:hypothetical protein
MKTTEPKYEEVILSSNLVPSFGFFYLVHRISFVSSIVPYENTSDCLTHANSAGFLLYYVHSSFNVFRIGALTKIIFL